MATFSYSAINAESLEFEGTLTAANLSGAIDQLRQLGLLADKLVEVEDAGGGSKSASSSAFKAVKPKSLQIFSRQFATMIEAGMNVVSALVILEQQNSDAVLS